MIILIHIIVAFTSIVVASAVFFNPSMKKLIVSYGLILGTIISGTILLVSAPSHVLESCVMGLSYLTIASFATIATHVRLHQRHLAIIATTTPKN